MNWSVWIRQIHRWLSIAFTATVIANFVAMAMGEPPSWVVYSPLLPLFLLLFTGLYMFALPYAVKCRRVGHWSTVPVSVKLNLGEWPIIQGLSMRNHFMSRAFSSRIVTTLAATVLACFASAASGGGVGLRGTGNAGSSAPNSTAGGDKSQARPAEHGSHL
jgi:cellulose synthase/poly-beta-1,6-N-acetylglucosamine synthase-like glycosyltransferase